MEKRLTIGQFGYGVVGHGVYDIIAKTPGLHVDVKRICAKHPEKKRDLPMSMFTFDKYEILDDPQVNLIVEVINNAEDAYVIVKEAMERGKNVVTANKKMVAEHLEEWVALQKKYGVSLLYEASACGSIPIIRNLEEYYDNELLYSVSGIFNGSSNYILSRMYNENIDYDIALKQAQDYGFAETDPMLDLAGYDALYKLVIVAAHAYGVFVKPNEVLHHGIVNLNECDIQYAREKGYKIKTISRVQRVGDTGMTMYVLPEFTTEANHMHTVENEYNAVEVEASFSEKQFFKGKGAGGHPTGSAVISDISANHYDYKYAYKKYTAASRPVYTTEVVLDVYLRYFDEKNLQLFKFEKIFEKYVGTEHSYVTGRIRLADLLAIQPRLNTADIQLVDMTALNKFETVY